MSKILCITSGLRGITNASLELVHRLRLAGHHVEYGSNKDIRSVIEGSGVVFHKLDEISLDPGPVVPFENRLLRILYKQIFKRSRKRKALVAMDPKKLKALLLKNDFDLVIIDMELHEFIILAVSMNAQVLLVSQWFSNWRLKGLPSIMSDIIPDQDWKEEDHWSKISTRRRSIFKKKDFRSGGTDRSILLRDFAKIESFPERFLGENFWPGPFLYDEIPVISMTLEDLEFPHIHRKNLTYVGPMVFESRQENLNDALQEKIDLAKNSGLKIIYCSLSTLHVGDLNFIRKVLEACRENSGWYLVVSLGGRMEASEFDLMPPNIVICKEVPQLEVLSKADCSVNHGGIHTINECIHFAVPMLVYSGKKSDQNGCAARVHYHGAGIMADKDIDDVKTISSKIHDILTDSKYKQQMKKFKEASKKCNENKTLERFVSEYQFSKEVEI